MDCDEDKIVTFQQLRKHVALKHPDRLKDYLSIIPEEPDPNAMDHPLRCSLCGWINNGVVLNCRHRELFHDLGDHVCDECQGPNLTHYDLIIHRCQKHFKPTKFLPLSTHGLDSITKDDGKIEMRKSKVICQLCLKEYKKDDGVIRHLRTVHSWGMFICEPCGEGCHFAQDLSTHVIQFYMDNPIVKCPSCTKDCNLGEDYEELNVHYKECIRKILKMQTKSSFQCEICGKEHPSKNNLELHVDAHQGNIRFKCSFCEFGSNHKNVIEDHERTHLVDQAISRGTGKDLLHPCERCGKHLRTAKLLKRHIRVVHEGIKPKYPRKECGVIFQYFVPLCRHRREEHGVIVGNKHKS